MLLSGVVAATPLACSFVPLRFHANFRPRKQIAKSLTTHLIWHSTTSQRLGWVPVIESAIDTTVQKRKVKRTRSVVCSVVPGS